MEHQHTPSVIEPDRPLRISPAVWLIGVGLITALLAVFVFKVAAGTVITYSFIGLMLVSHLFMHGGHGSHGGHSDQAQRQDPSSTVDGPARQSSTPSKDDPVGHSGGYH
jgi:hypothetical protein